MLRQRISLVMVAVVSVISFEAMAEQLKYQPINPAFGGSPLNGSFLMGNATAQRQYAAPVKRKDPVEEFSRQIQASLLSRISREISDAILGEDAKESGHFSVGGTEVDFERADGQIAVTIKDPRTGASTLIELPDPAL